MDLSASPLTLELPRPFIAACVVSIAVHAGVAGWYMLDTDTTAVQLPRPTLHVKVHALRERVSITSGIKRINNVVRQVLPHRDPPPVTTPTPRPVKTSNHSNDTPEKTQQEAPPPVQVTVAAVDNRPTYSPPSCNSASLNNPKPDYPRVALRRGIEGLVLLLVEVNEQGHPIEIQVKKSAGFKPLDIAALKAVRRWQFLPAQRNGTSVRASVEIPVRFRLDEADHSDS